MDRGRRRRLRQRGAAVTALARYTIRTAPERVLGAADLRAALRAVPPGSAQRIVEQLAALAMGKEGTPPRDDIAVLALRARG